MKKLLTVLMMIISIFVYVPSVFGATASVNILNSVTPVKTGTSIQNAANAYDSDPMTYLSYSASSSTAPNDTLQWNFTEPQTVDAVILKAAIDGTGGGFIDVEYLISGSSEWIKLAQVSSKTPSGTPKVFIPAGSNQKYSFEPIKNVTAIKLKFSKYGYPADFKVYNVEVFTSVITENPEPEKFVIKDLSYTVNSLTSITLTWTPVDSQFLKHYKIYRNDELISTTNNSSYSISGLVPGDAYSFKVTAVDTLNDEFVDAGSTVSYTPPLPDTTPPSEPVGLTVTPGQYDAVVTWTENTEPDLNGYIVYLNGSRVTNNISKATRFDLKGLSPETAYEVELSAIDISGNESTKAKQAFETLSLTVAPDAPTNLTGSAFGGGVNLNWMPSRFASKYHVYQNGEKVAETERTNIKITGLNNGSDYSFEVSAVNAVGESSKSASIILVPDPNKAPPVSLGYSLQDVALGAASWFASIWMLLAFCIAIPLAFYVGNRVKGLFA